MTTVVDPLGTPAPTYNRSGITIVAVNGGPTMTPTPIPHVSGHTVALVTFSAGNDKVELPSSAEIGDFVEVCPSAALGGDAFLPGGDSFFNIGGNSSSVNAPVFFRKVGATLWIAHKSS